MEPEITTGAFAAVHADGAFVVDVREPPEYLGGHVPGAVLMPLAQVLVRRSELLRHQPVYLICGTGNRSSTAAGWLRERGITAVSVTGGTSAWIAEGHPVVCGATASTV